MQQGFEFASQRAWEDTRKWLRDSFIAWIVVAVFFGVVSAIFIPTSDALIYRAIYGAIVAIIALILIVSITYIVHLIITPYRQRNDLRKIIGEQENKPKAKIEASELLAGMGDVNYTKRNIVVNNIYAAAVRFANNSSEISAKNVWAKISYYDSKEETELGSLIASWDELSDTDIFPAYATDIREVELKPKGPPYTIVLAIKHTEDEACYAYNSENYNYKDLRKPGYKLDGEKFVMFITLVGQNVDEDIFGGKQFAYILHNNGKGQGLIIEPYPDTKL